MATGSSGSKRKPHRNPRPQVSVLRVGHRVGRDPRLTTHLALAARALGADRMYLEPPDPDLAARVAALAKGWGGSFEVVGVRDWKQQVRSYAGIVVHLTMYGQPLERVLPRILRSPRVLLAVGGAKVPPDLYRLSTLNVAVGHQPHSEVAAVAVVLDRLLGVPGPGRWPGAERAVVPRVRGKKVAVRRRAG
ncbi:MAG: tRNA (cytidine(56)-2'-O)-methyltransferase [Thermoplasmata archaeon]